MKARVTVKLKNGVLDPQGKAVQHAAQSLGFEEIKDVRVGKSFEIELEGKDPAAATTKLSQLSEKLLANTVIETFEVEII
jgi:phosphoribosylformylglycinamidine synthase subunit PurS